MPELVKVQAVREPCFSEHGCRLFRGDAREVCRDLRPESFDCIVTDPPYGEGILDDGDCSPDAAAKLFGEVLTAAKPLLAPAAHLAFFWSNRSLDRGINAALTCGFEFKRLLTMYVPHSGARPYRGWLPKTQPIVVMKLPGRAMPRWREGPARDILQGMQARGWSRARLAAEMQVSDRLVMKWTRIDDPFWSYPTLQQRMRLLDVLGIALPDPPETSYQECRHDVYEVRSGKRLTQHPCEKPLWILEDMLPRLGGNILDPFAGSGSTLLAAEKAGLDCTGIEIEARYCQEFCDRRTATERIAA